MMSNAIQDTIKATSSALFLKFVKQAASVSPATAALVVAGIGSVIFAAGGVQEAALQSSMLVDAREAYQATTPTSIFQLMGRAMAGDLTSDGLKTSGMGAWLATVGPAVTYAASKLAQSTPFIKNTIERLEQSTRPRGASRIAEFQNTAERIKNTSPAMYHPEPANKPKFKGPQ